MGSRKEAPPAKAADPLEPQWCGEAGVLLLQTLIAVHLQIASLLEYVTKTVFFTKGLPKDAIR